MLPSFRPAVVQPLNRADHDVHLLNTVFRKQQQPAVVVRHSSGHETSDIGSLAREGTLIGTLYVASGAALSCHGVMVERKVHWQLLRLLYSLGATRWCCRSAQCAAPATWIAEDRACMFRAKAISTCILITVCWTLMTGGLQKTCSSSRVLLRRTT